MTIDKAMADLGEHIKKYAGDARSAYDKLQTQVDAIDLKMVTRNIHGEGNGPGIRAALDENESLQRVMKDRKGTAILSFEGKAAAAIFERKTTITTGVSGTIGSSTSGVLMQDRDSGIVIEARQGLTIRDVLASRSTEAQLIDFVKVTSPMTIASPVAEASQKAENAVTLGTASERVKTVASWIPASKQAIEDVSELQAFIETTLAYYVNLAIELQLLTGDGTGENLHGLIPQSTAFSTGLLSASLGWNKMDIVGRAIQQVTTAKELQPTFVVMAPGDWWDIRLTKDNYGRYILGDPQAVVRPSLFGLDVIPTTSIASNSFLVGSGSPVASEIRDRMQVQVEISTSHSDYFTKNLLAIRGEARLALVVKRPGSYVSGSFSQSPA